MEFTKEQQIKIDNYKEHYNSILGNIKVANDRLSFLLDAIKEEETYMKGLKSEKEDFKKEKEKARLWFSKESDSHKEMEIDLGLFLKVIDNNFDELKELKAKTESNLKDKEATYNSKFQELNNIIKTKEIQLINVESVLVYAQKVLEETNTEVNKLNKQRIETSEELSKINKEISEKKELFNKEMTSDLKELEELKEQIIKEQSRVGKADESILEREKSLKVKEKDLYIIITRIRKKHKELFPELNLQL